MCDDCINRRELLRYLSSKRFGHSEYEDGQEANNLDIIDFVEYMDAVDAKPVAHGKWEEYEVPNIICCSVCDWGTGVDEKSNYCPNCGAKMDYE